MDIIQPFMLENGLFRGSLINVDQVVADIWKKQNYPKALRPVLHQAVLTATALSAGIKYQGVFSLQIKGNGPISSLFVDVTTDQKIRAYMRLNPEGADWEKLKTISDLFGQGQMIFSVAGLGQEPYQGVVALAHETLADVVKGYFQMSEQINTDLILRQVGSKGRCLILQQMPNKADVAPEVQADLWETVTVLMNSVRDEELFSDKLTAGEVLFRLFHANGLQTFEPKMPTFSCRCYRGKMETFLKKMAPDERQALYNPQGQIETICQFCGEKYVFTRADLGDEPAASESPKKTADNP